MEITYQRNLHKSYMCIEEQENIIEEHEMIILQKYRVPQLLPIQMIVQDGKVQYWFEITGKQQLKDYLGGKTVNMEHIKRFLFSLEKLCQKIPEFLLKEERICLKEELLYVDLMDETIYFTYLPFRRGDFLEEFRGWMEETLKKIDHQDRKCTELAYDLYERVRRENISIRELLDAEQWNQEKENIVFTEAVESQILKKEEVRQIEEKEQKKVLRDKIKQVCMERKDEIKDRVLEGSEKYIKFIREKKFYREGNVIREKKSDREKDTIKEKNVLNQQETEGNQTDIVKTEQKNPTEPLELYPGRPEGKLIYQGRNGCQDFWIEKEEFLIGRSIQQADGRIETDGISRIHARIVRKEGEYYIEDLNSTNGTYLNGELLEYHRDQKLKRNDRLRFGIEEYVFC